MFVTIKPTTCDNHKLSGLEEAGKSIGFTTSNVPIAQSHKSSVMAHTRKYVIPVLPPFIKLPHRDAISGTTVQRKGLPVPNYDAQISISSPR